MEHEGRANNNQFGAQSNFVRKTNIRQDFGSPRFMRKKDQVITDVKGILTRNKEVKVEPRTSFCYISPRKVLDHPNCDSFQSLGSTPQTTAISTTNTIPANPSTIPTQYSNSSHLLKSPYNPQTARKTSDTAKQLVTKTKTISQQNYQLKKRIEQITTKLQQKQLAYITLQNRNTEIILQCQQLEQQIINKDISIRQLKNQLHQKDKEIDSYKQLMSSSARNLQNLLDNIKRNNNYKCHNCMKMSIETEEQDQKQKIERQCNKYRNQMIVLNSKLKYLELQQNMYKKLKFDYQELSKKNQNLKKTNKKLLMKLDTLNRQNNITQRNNGGIMGNVNNKKTLKDSDISFDLSPDR